MRIPEAMLCLAVLSLRAVAADPEWATRRSHRVLLRVPAAGIGERTSDEMPAVVTLDLDRLLGGNGQRADLSTLQVTRYDPATGKPIPYSNWLYGQTPHDRPLQWYDAAIPDLFPDRDRSTQSPWIYRQGWGSYYEATGDWKQGRLAWAHTQDGRQDSFYAAYFDLLPSDGKQTAPAPRGWIGDGSKRTAPLGATSTGAYHVDCQMIDFNQDGLLDFLCGTSRGGILWYENLGTRQKPKYAVGRMLFYSDGKPIDPGFLSTPTATDWDRDGKLDILVGMNKGWAHFYRNVGTNLAPRYEDRGPLQADGKPLRTPAAPVPEVAGPNGESIYKEDYQPFLEVVDWDGDGDDDLLIGGYVTGRIFWYENTGRDAQGLPVLKFNGHLMADGKPLDVGWCANPTVADIDGDGDLDIITGVWRKWGNDSPPEVVEDFVAYFENIGTRKEPKLTMKALPRTGKFPDEAIASPTLADWDGDGDLDLAVSVPSGNLFLFENDGNPRRPHFNVKRPMPLKMPWGNDPLPRTDSSPLFLADRNGDGRPDLVSGYQVASNEAAALPWKFGPYFSILRPGETIDHRAWRGDDWQFTVQIDFDQDGQTDILFGDYYGQVWFHKNLSAGAATRFDTEGILIRTADGKPLRVGRDASAPYDFDSMQGPRTGVIAADFDGDGAVDLILNDVFGHYYYCRRGRHGKEAVVESQVPLAKIKGYATNLVVDWDQDGRPDLLVSQLQNHSLYRNVGGARHPFAEPQTLELPLVPVIGAVVHVIAMDVNADGDRDLVIQSDHGYDCFFEGSFLARGFAAGEFIGIEQMGR